MICIQLPGKLTEEFITLIPKQRKLIDELMDNGKILQYSVSMDRTQLWITMVAQSERKALDIITTFPLVHYMKPKFLN